MQCSDLMCFMALPTGIVGRGVRCKLSILLMGFDFFDQKKRWPNLHRELIINSRFNVTTIIAVKDNDVSSQSSQ